MIGMRGVASLLKWEQILWNEIPRRNGIVYFHMQNAASEWNFHNLQPQPHLQTQELNSKMIFSLPMCICNFLSLFFRKHLFFILGIIDFLPHLSRGLNRCRLYIQPYSKHIFLNDGGIYVGAFVFWVYPWKLYLIWTCGASTQNLWSGLSYMGGEPQSYECISKSL